MVVEREESSPEHLRGQRQGKTAVSVEIYRPPAARRAPNNQTAVEAISPTKSPDATSVCAKSNSRQKRPDRAVYVPKHRRSSELEGSPQPVERHRPNRPSENLTQISPVATGRPFPYVSLNDHGSAGAQTLTEIAKDDNQRQPRAQSNSKSNAPVSPVASVPHESLPQQEGRREDDVEKTSESAEIPAERNVSDDEHATTDDRHSSTEALAEALAEEENADLDRPAKCIIANHTECSVGAENEKASTRKVTGEASTDWNSIGRCNDENSDDGEERLQPNENNREIRQTVSSNEINNKNANIRPVVIRGNMISDVLVISETAKKEQENNAINNKQSSAISVTPLGKKPKKVERLKSKPAPPPPPSPPPLKINRDECDWDSLFDDNGDCLDPSLIQELTSAVGQVVIEQPKNDYKAYAKQVEVSNDEFAHVVEIYNFPSDFKTSDLAAVFSPFKNGGFELKWVDDTHCLGVFSSPLIAAEVLASNHPFVKTRPLREATAQSKTKARRSAEFLQPYRSRPKTCAALARRLVTGALGVKLATARQEREQEKIVLREAKEKRRLANKQREDAWEGIIPEK